MIVGSLFRAFLLVACVTSIAGDEIEMARIFVSYAHGDRDIVVQLTEEPSRDGGELAKLLRLVSFRSHRLHHLVRGS